MHLALCHRAWEPSQNEAMASLMQRWGIQFLETASGKYPEGLAKCTVSILDQHKTFWAQHKVSIIGLQSLLFGARLQPFMLSDEAAEAALSALKALILPSQTLGIKKWVFGSYQLRNRGGLSIEAANERMAAFLLQIAPELAKAGVILVVEAVPKLYGADYLTTHEEVWQLVQLVNHAHIKLHLDLGAAYINGERTEVLTRLLPYCHHVHISASNFNSIETVPKHQLLEWATLLQDCPAEFLSIEMFEHVTKADYSALEKSISLVQECFLMD